MIEKNEQRETIQADFVSEFNKRLAAIPEMHMYQIQRDFSSEELVEIGVRGFKKKAVALVFFPGSDITNLNIWVKDPAKCNSYSPHTTPSAELDQYLKLHQIAPENFDRRSAYVFEDAHGNKFLLFEKADFADAISITDDPDEVKGLTNLIKKYGISKIIGSFVETPADKNGILKTIFVDLTRDVLGADREKNYLLSFGKKYNMTNSQFMRFRLLANANKNAALTDKEGAESGVHYLTDLDKLAQEIISQE